MPENLSDLSKLLEKVLAICQPATNKFFEDVGHKIITKATKPTKDQKLWKILMRSEMQNKIYKFIVKLLMNNAQNQNMLPNCEEALGHVLMVEAVDAITKDISLDTTREKWKVMEGSTRL